MEIKLILLIISFVSPSFALQCKDEDGNDVDWYIVYKLPGSGSYLEKDLDLETQAKLTGRTGFNYAYMTSNDADGKWKFSSKTVQDKDSIWGQTLAPAYKSPSDYTYAMWNDGSPTETNFTKEHAMATHARLAHSKGVAVMDKTTGFYLHYTIPKFVKPFNESYEYPYSGRIYGQVSFCISFDTQIEGPKVAAHLVHMQPNIYGKNLVEGVPKQSSNWEDLFAGIYPKNAETSIETKIVSLGGLPIRAFSKGPRHLVDIYGAVVAPALESGLYVETWRQNRGGILRSDCTLDHKVNNVIDFKFDFDDNQTTGPLNFLNDHSKWAISSDDYNSNYVCLGDSNRMASQAKRGGGIMCFQDNNVHKAFRSLVKSIEGCTAESDGGRQETGFTEGTPI